MFAAVHWGWPAFGGVVGLFLLADLLAHRRDRPDDLRRASAWAAAAVALGIGFGGYVWYDAGPRAGGEYLAAYLLEECLSLDNLFVFLVVFRTMRIPEHQQRSALTWGVFGALLFRGIFIFLGAEALERWAWIEYVFAALLFYGAWHAFREDPSSDAEESAVVGWLSRHLRVSRPQEEVRFFVREGGLLKATPLFVAVIGLEVTDLLFAVDSVPAAFSVTHDRFLVYSSNVLAILGLRSLYVVLAHTIGELRYLHYGLAAVLAFAASKIVLAKVGVDVPPAVAVAAIVSLIGSAAAASVVAARAGRSESPAQAGVDADPLQTTADRAESSRVP